MHPSKVDRKRLRVLTDLPNVGPATAGDLIRLGYENPSDLKGADPVELYERLCRITGQRHDPCVLDVFMSITSFLAGGTPKHWREYTAQRKRQFG